MNPLGRGAPVRSIVGTAQKAVVALFTAACSISQAQSPPQTTLIIDLQNAVEYQQDDSSIPSKLATNPNLTPSGPHANFFNAMLLADIVAVNGQPAKGLYAGRSRVMTSSPVASPGVNIADVSRTAIREHLFEILKSDGTPIGTIMSVGFSGGPPPPGAPSTDRANWAIVGGTGAFLGARGTVAGTGGVARAASMTEDPANRRTNGGTSFSFIVHLIPMSQPQIAVTSNGPAVVHSTDFTLITPTKPAAAGEILSLFADGSWTHGSSSRTGASVSYQPTRRGQLAARRDGEWRACRNPRRGGIPRGRRWLPGQF
jgi:hypothetical protein